MAGGKKAKNTTGQDKKTKSAVAKMSPEQKKQSSGFGCSNLPEAVPDFNKAACEKIQSTPNNSWIVMGRDRCGPKTSGYGGAGDTQAGMIDLVVGRGAPGPLSKKADPIFIDKKMSGDPVMDAARIYISQKTDVDKNFDLTRGSVGISDTKSAVAIKADGLRFMAREGIKIITGVHNGHNSQGGYIGPVIEGIDLIAGNNSRELQPLVKGNSLIKCLESIIDEIEVLHNVICGLTTSQVVANAAFSSHFHASPFFGTPTSPPTSAAIGASTNCRLLSATLTSNVVSMSNLTNMRLDYLSPAGGSYVCSRKNKTT